MRPLGKDKSIDFSVRAEVLVLLRWLRCVAGQMLACSIRTKALCYMELMGACLNYQGTLLWDGDDMKMSGVGIKLSLCRQRWHPI